MSTYTKNAGIEKPIPGSQEGTWGGTVNTNFDIIDEAINGIVTITLTSAGTSGSPNEIEITDGSLSNGRNAYIEFSDNSSLAGADVYVALTETGGTVDAERVVWIKNSLPSGDNLYLFQGTYNAGRDYVIANGLTALVRFTGGGDVAACYVYPVLENIQMDGTLTVAGVITGSNLSGSNTGDNAGVTSVDTSGALSGGPITTTGTITHLNTDGYKHLPSGGTVGQFPKNTAAGSASWVSLAVADLSDYVAPAMYDNAGTPTLTAGITAAEYRLAIGAGTSDTVGTVTQVDGGNGLTGSVTASGSLAVGAGTGITVNTDDLALTYAGAGNFIRSATDLEGTAISVNDSIIYNDVTDGTIKKGLISDLPGIGSAGTVTSVASGDGMNFTEITGTGTVTLGTPGSATATSTNAVTATSHTHAVDATIARIASPAFTGTPTAPTQTVGNSSTRLATTAFVNAEIANDAPLKDGTGATGTWGIDITGNAGTASTATSANSATTAASVSSAAQPAITSVGTLTSLLVSGEIETQSNLSMIERAGAPTVTATEGKLWVKSDVPNTLWYTNDAGTSVQLDTGATGTVTSVSGGTGLSGTVTTAGSIALDYSGTDSFLYAATDGANNVSTSDYFVYYDVTDSTVKKETISQLPFTDNIGDITNVSAGNGLTGGGISNSVTITMGTPGSLNGSSTNSVSTSSHTHAVSLTAADVGAATSSHGHSDLGALDSSPTFTGTVTAGGFTVSSALRLKNILEPFDAIRSTALFSLDPLYYTLKADETKKRRIGYIADHVEALFPELVSRNEDGEIAGMDYAGLVVPIIELLKEYEHRLSVLEAE